MQSSFDPLDEFERIARNLPLQTIDKKYPRVTDGTTSSIVKKTPRRILQQIPTGTVISDTNDWLSIVASFIYLNRILPNANEMYALIQKCWLMISRTLTYGAAHSQTPFMKRGDYFGTDLSIPYIKNVYYEPGKLSNNDSNCLFVDAWYQPADIDAIIKKEKSLAKKAKKRNEPYEPTWDIAALQDIKKNIQAKTTEEESKYSKNNSSSDQDSGIKLTHAFQIGVDAEFYTFHLQSEQIVRTKKNKDPRGKMPVQTMYFEVDGINPLGTGLVEQLAPLQNLMDAEMQMYQWSRALMLDPPAIKRGTWTKSKAKYEPGILVDLGNDPIATWEPVKLDTTAINNFPDNYGLMKSQLLNMAASPDTSISSSIGNPGFSKTPAGVNVQQANISVDDNYIRKQFESWFEEWSETAINLYFAERTGKEELQLDKETAQKLRKLEVQGKLKPGFVSDDDKIIIDYDAATEVLRFEVDASTSNMKNDAQQLEALDGLLARLEKSQILAETLPQEKVLGAWNAIVSASAVENPEDLSIDIEQWKQEQEAQQQAQMELEQQKVASEQALLQQTMQPPQPAGMQLQPAPVEPPMTEEDRAFITALEDMGYSPEKIQQALAMEESGMAEEEIIAMLESING